MCPKLEENMKILVDGRTVDVFRDGGGVYAKTKLNNGCYALLDADTGIFNIRQLFPDGDDVLLWGYTALEYHTEMNSIQRELYDTLAKAVENVYGIEVNR